MRRLSKPAADWTLRDVEALIAERVPEGQRIEYKRELKLDRESDRRESAKDLSGLANTDGGLILYGVAEDDSDDPIPVSIEPITDAGLQTRLEDLVDSSVSPPLRMHVQPLPTKGGLVLVVRVEPRSGGLHMVQGYKQYRFFARRGTRTRPMTEDEVRTAYETVMASEDRIERLLASLPLVPRITRHRAADELAFRARGISPEWLPWTSVVVAPLDAPHELLTPEHVKPDAFPEIPERCRSQHGIRVERYTIDAFGLTEESLIEGKESTLQHRVRLHRSGVFEWGRRWQGDEWRSIPSTSFAEAVHDALAYFASVYESLNYFGHLATWVRIDNAEEAVLRISQRYSDSQTDHSPGIESINAYDTTSVDALLADPLPMTRWSMDRIWQAFGYSKCLIFDADGNWRPS